MMFASCSGTNRFRCSVVVWLGRYRAVVAVIMVMGKTQGRLLLIRLILREVRLAVRWRASEGRRCPELYYIRLGWRCEHGCRRFCWVRQL